MASETDFLNDALGQIGVVRVREMIGPAHVVPVRETATETPRVKIVRV